MDIQIQPWKDVNSEELARFILETRREEGLATENITINTILTSIEWWANRTDSTPLIAYSDEQIVGWLVIFSFVPTIATLGRWHPIVKSGPDKDEIAQQLLKTSIAHVKRQHYGRLEAELTGITPDNESWYHHYARWYEAQGFNLSSEEARLEKDLTQQSLPEPKIPPGFELRPLEQVSNEVLQDPFFEMFDNSKDRFWLDQTPEQRVEAFKFWLDRERPFVEDATAVLVKGEEIVGLTIVRPIQEVGMLGPIAILPEFRQQGLGRSLMAVSFQGAKKNGIPKIQLEFDITNEPAFNLYTQLGFQHVHRLVIFAMAL